MQGEFPEYLISPSLQKSKPQKPSTREAHNFSFHGTDMATLSTDIATTFMGIAKRRSVTLSRVRTTVLPLLWRTKTRHSQTHTFLSFSTHQTVVLDMFKPIRGSRRYTVAATTSSQAETADVLTKIPPDDRIPATIITGFLGSGKVRVLGYFNFLQICGPFNLGFVSF